MNNDNVKALAGDIDLMIGQLRTQYQLDPLQLSAVILARIMRLNFEMGEADTFNKLMENAIEDGIPDNGTIQ